MKKLWLVLVVGSVFAVAPARARDTWDMQGNYDDLPSSYLGNELVHGTVQVHDLEWWPPMPPIYPAPRADQDWYLIAEAPYSSYEVVVDSTSSDFGTSGVSLDFVNDSGTVLYSSKSIGQGKSRSLCFMNALSTPVTNRYVRVQDTAGCGAAFSCDASDTYRIRYYDTTIAVPRFNNSGTQVTVLIMQNPTDYNMTPMVYFWNTSGTMIGSYYSTVAAHSTTVLNTATVSGVSNASGSITIMSGGRFGDLVGKATALEASTGFTFDTPFVVKP